MNKKILEILKKVNKALTQEELISNLGLSKVEEIQEGMKIIKEMEESFEIYKTNKNKYTLFELTSLRYGVLNVNKKGFGFLDLPDTMDDIYIDKSNMNGAIDGDMILIELITPGKNPKKEGKVIKVIERKRTEFIGEFKVNRNNQGFVSLDDNKVKMMVDIKDEYRNGAVTGHKVIVSVYKKVEENKYLGKIIRVLGHKDDAGMDILSICYKYDIEPDFLKATIEELKNIPKDISKEDISKRRDLRNEMIFTIDGKDTKDIDDAISVEKLENGNYKLGVHIADVSYYVKPNTSLDMDAYTRGTSVYLADTVIPMIPHQLSNGICSLNPNVDRLAVSCVMEINEKGKTVDYEIFESVINSKKKMNYDDVNELIYNDIIVEGYEKYADTLKEMYNLSKLIRKMKQNRGFINFDTKEVKIIQEGGIPIDIVKREQKEGEKLIEDFMICANECVATHLFNMGLPSIYRVHDKPSPDRLKTFSSFVSLLGINLNNKLIDPKPYDLRDILENLKPRKEYRLLSDMLLRTMKKAEYSDTNIGHYGIASTCYTHFTSPIRRYPDTIIHRLLRTYLFNKDTSIDTLNYYKESLPQIAFHTSTKEKNSVSCEREVDDMKMAEYMENHIGEEFEGMVCSVLNFGMFIELDNGVEGLVRINTIDGDYFEYDESRLCLRGQNTKITYTIGDIVKIKVISASKVEKTIDFELIKEEQDGNNKQEC
ncbi:MAG: ribonuclease R [Bacilli bacterium]